MAKTILTVLITLFFVFFIGAVGFYFLAKTQNIKIQLSQEPTPTQISQDSAPLQTSKPKPTVNETSIPNGWLTYKNNTYGFQISYPPDYKVLDDPNNLYGWKNGVVLFYKGGQSYDLAVQAWSLESEYKQEYPNTPNLTVHQIGNIYITLLNNNFDSEVDSIIETFSKN